jgi:hypothetical protein
VGRANDHSGGGDENGAEDARKLADKERREEEGTRKERREREGKGKGEGKKRYERETVAKGAGKRKGFVTEGRWNAAGRRERCRSDSSEKAIRG